jgi:C_GCAxxG_C_C family probable redox protein
MSDALQRASTRFASGFNCAQSVFSAFAGECGVTEEQALRLAAPFGAGFGRAGETCGALSGALMVLGARYASGRPEQMDEIYAMTRQFVEHFRQRHASILCRDILGHDISVPDGLKAARTANAFAKVCPVIVDETARALEAFLREHPVK